MKDFFQERNFSRRNFLRGLAAVFALSFLGAGSVSTAGTDDAALSRWNKMSEDQKDLIKKRWAEFKAMKPEEQQEILSSYQSFRSLSEEQQKQIQKNYEHWKTLSKEQQDAIAKRYAEWKSLTEEERAKLSEQLKGESDGAGKTAK